MNDGDAKRCQSMHWYDPSDCVLPLGHEGEHRDAYGLTWTDADNASARHIARAKEPSER
jgi:hypothetical protein